MCFVLICVGLTDRFAQAAGAEWPALRYGCAVGTLTPPRREHCSVNAIRFFDFPNKTVHAAACLLLQM